MKKDILQETFEKHLKYMKQNNKINERSHGHIEKELHKSRQKSTIQQTKDLHDAYLDAEQGEEKDYKRALLEKHLEIRDKIDSSGVYEGDLKFNGNDLKIKGGGVVSIKNRWDYANIIPADLKMISGDLMLENLKDIFDLRWLNNIKEVKRMVLLRNLQITDLLGCPSTIGESFVISNCEKLTTLRHSPYKVGVDFICKDGNLESLHGGPNKVVGKYDVSGNKLKNLEGAPKKVNFFICSRNQIQTLKGGVEECNTFMINNNPIRFSPHEIAPQFKKIKSGFFQTGRNYVNKSLFNIRSKPKELRETDTEI